MAVKAVTVWKAEDGSVHPDQKTAQKHNVQFKIRSGIAKIIAETTPSQQLRAFTIDMLNSPEALTKMRDICNKGLQYHRDYGKLKKK